MKKMGDKSRSFLRFREYTYMTSPIFANWRKTEIMKYLQDHNRNYREVFWAENLNNLSAKELRTFLRDIQKTLIDHQKEDIFIEPHLTDDSTMKTPHLHLWGNIDDDCIEIVKKKILEYNMSNRYQVLATLESAKDIQKLMQTQSIAQEEEFQLEIAQRDERVLDISFDKRSEKILENIKNMHQWLEENSILKKKEDGISLDDIDIEQYLKDFDQFLKDES
jgi:hypothetical protein